MLEDIANEPCAEEMLDCYYTYVQAVSGTGKEQYLECLAYDPGQTTNMVQIPDERGGGALALPESGIILPKGYAESMGVKPNDFVTINNVAVKVIHISYQYFHPIVYLSKAQMDDIGVSYVFSLLLNTNDQVALSQAINAKTNQSLLVFTSSLPEDLHQKLDPLNVFLVILIAFSVVIAFAVLFIMAKNALLEQIFQFSLYRALGFRLSDISNIWLTQRIVQLVLATVFAIPLSVIGGHILFGLVSTSIQTYPFIFSMPMIGIGLAFVIAVIAICHLLSLSQVKRINLAYNLRSGE